jgi:Protein of unknown function (DUF1173)
MWCRIRHPVRSRSPQRAVSRLALPQDAAFPLFHIAGAPWAVEFVHGDQTFLRVGADAHARGRVERPQDSPGQVVEFDRGDVASHGDVGRHAAQEVADAAAGVQDSPAFEPQAAQCRPDPADDEGLGVVAVVDRGPGRLVLSPEDAVQYKMAIIVGEHNGSEPTAFGRRIVVKHMPDVPLYIENKAWERVKRSYAAILQARDGDVSKKPRAMMAALVYAKREYVYQVDTVSMMLTTDQWIPMEGLHELPLIEVLQRATGVLETVEVRRQIGGGFSQRLAAGQWNCADAAAGDESAHGGERAVGQGKVLAGLPALWVWMTAKSMPALPAHR